MELWDSIWDNIWLQLLKTTTKKKRCSDILYYRSYFYCTLCHVRNKTKTISAKRQKRAVSPVHLKTRLWQSVLHISWKRPVAKKKKVETSSDWIRRPRCLSGEGGWTWAELFTLSNSPFHFLPPCSQTCRSCLAQLSPTARRDQGQRPWPRTGARQRGIRTAGTPRSFFPPPPYHESLTQQHYWFFTF